MSNSFAIFDTAIGACGIVWNASGIAGVQIHDGTERATRVRLLRRFGGAQEAAPPVHVQRAIDGVVALLRGEKRDLSDVAIDTSLPTGNQAGDATAARRTNHVRESHVAPHRRAAQDDLTRPAKLAWCLVANVQEFWI